MKVLVFAFAALALVILVCAFYTRKLLRDIALEDADEALRSEYETLANPSHADAFDRGKK